ncbi:MAG: thioesterase family protein [Proteobacteria bacterium]|nr:thioesterase family protein [Pseudomonadota bacterium]
MTLSQFDRETSVTRIDDNHFRGHLSPAWNIGDNPNGGYLVSNVLRALSNTLVHVDPVSITTHFLRPGVADADCEIFVETVRAGRTLSTARATLSQQGKARIEVLAAFSDLSVSAGIDTAVTLPAPVLPEPEICIPRSGDAQGLTLPITSRLDIRLDPAFATPGEAGCAEMAGWVRYTDGREPDAQSLPLFADAFPPSPLGLLGAFGWVPTLELTVNVVRRPAPGWIRAHFKTDDLANGRMIESGALWDSEGRLVAQSRQLGLVIGAQTGP